MSEKTIRLDVFLPSEKIKFLDPNDSPYITYNPAKAPVKGEKFKLEKYLSTEDLNARLSADLPFLPKEGENQYQTQYMSEWIKTAEFRAIEVYDYPEWIHVYVVEVGDRYDEE